MTFRTFAGQAARVTAGALSVTSTVLDQAAGALRHFGEAAPAEPEQPQSQPHKVDVEHSDDIQVVQTPARGGARTSAPDVPAPTTTPGRISNPKRARSVRKRQQATATTKAPAEVRPETGHGGTPATVEAENTPKERSAAKAGRQAAPMGSTKD